MCYVPGKNGNMCFVDTTGKFFLEISQDEYADNDPREWNPLGHMWCFHGHYQLGDKHDLVSEQFDGWDDMEDYLYKELDARVVLPLRLYDHSGIGMSTSASGYPWNCPWDSGWVGFIFATAEDIRKNWNVKRVTKQLVERTKAILEAEVELYDHYISGEVYSGTLYEKKECTCCEEITYEWIDGCGGYIGEIGDCTDQIKQDVGHGYEWEEYDG